MGLIEQAQQDLIDITTDLNGFGLSIILTAPNLQVVNIVGIHHKHHLGIDTDGNAVNSKKSHCAISEKSILTANSLYPIRNANGEVNLRGHKLSVIDSTQIVKNYIIKEWFPDESLGLIVVILGDYI